MEKLRVKVTCILYLIEVVSLLEFCKMLLVVTARRCLSPALHQTSTTAMKQYGHYSIVRWRVKLSTFHSGASNACTAHHHDHVTHHVVEEVDIHHLHKDT